MAVRIPTYFVLLLVSLLSLFTTKSVAHNRYSIPSSCIGHPSLLKCALDFESALKATVSTKTHIEASALNVVLESINAAKAAGISILHFLSSIHIGLINGYPKIELSQNLNATIGIALQEIIKASAIVHGETKITLAELHRVEKSLNIASNIAAKLNVGVGLKQANSDTDTLLCNLIKQFNNLINLSLKVVGAIEANAKVSF